MVAHTQLVEKTKKGKIEVYFVGDSITRRWGATDYPQLLANWNKNFHGWNAANFGWGADRTQNILWRLNDGELDKVNPRIVVLQAGTNNVGNTIVAGQEEAVATDVVSGLREVVSVIAKKAPEATIIVTALFPRNDNMAVMPVINAINNRLASLADGAKVRVLNINGQLADPRGQLYDGMMDPDKLHPSEKTYQIWADALKPIFREILGEPRAEDRAPPPTGNPAAGQ
ncbi:MAG: GDSL-type esterase/lipase family protein [Acidobacteria bacterium]|nr:GDSL-type esterase/lipase family protein [Acidobacteriota bacterium]